MVYDLQFVANSTGLVEFVQRTSSELTQDMLGVMFLFIIFSVIFLATFFSSKSASRAFAASSFAAMTINLFLLAIDIVPQISIFITMTLAAGSVFLIRNSS